jgi:CubicO group peptidase (beta-lactamase class C family)
MNPVVPVNERPIYSQLSFTLVAYALNESLGMNYTELLDEYVSRPLGLMNTLPSPGDDKKAVIPPIDNSWGSDYDAGNNVP